MRGGPLTWIVGIAVGLVLVLVVTGAIGTRDDRNDTVTAGEWAQNVCGAVGVWRGELESIVEDIRTPSSAAPTGEEPQSETPQGRTALVRGGLERGIEAADTLVEGVDNAGTPDTPQGEEARSWYPTGRTRRMTTSTRPRMRSTRRQTRSRSRFSS